MPRQREIIRGYVGPMFGKKTLLLLNDVFAAEAVGEEVLVFKPSVDVRYGQSEIKSRAGGCHQAIAVNDSREIVRVVERIERKMRPNLVAIDEAQFFDPMIPEVVLYLSESGYQIVYSALNMNYRGEPFGPVRDLMPISTELTMVTARCTYPTGNGGSRKCGAEAKYTQRLINGLAAPYESPEVVIDMPGKTEVRYEARCVDHWEVPGMPKRLAFLHKTG